MSSFQIRGKVVDVVNRRIFAGQLEVKDGLVSSIKELPENDVPNQIVMPGFVDAHIHIESSMLVPSEFARLSVVHGTVATVSDPHEIANVLGAEGVRYMLDDAERVPFKIFFGAPSCVPATSFETAGAELDASAVRALLENPQILYLSEMMNWPGVLHQDAEVFAKIAAARELNKPVDGHAPGLRGEDAKQYVAAGISTDHECFALEEALGKIEYGMKLISIREGSAAKNLGALIDLFDTHPEHIALCSDDLHPDSLVIGHINLLVRRCVAAGKDLMNVLRAATYNPVKHYGLNVGLLQQGDAADFIIVSDLRDFEVLETYVQGKKVAERGKTFIEPVSSPVINQFSCKPILDTDILVAAQGETIRAIKVLDGQLITEEQHIAARVEHGLTVCDVERDLLKIVVYNRYQPAKPAVAFVTNFGLKRGALSSTVAHDCHNIIAVGTNDSDIVAAINTLIETKGGVAAVEAGASWHLPLPVAGLMSTEDGYQVAAQYEEIDRVAKQQLGCPLTAPFMTMSFLALLVIPSLKLSDKVGLFDGTSFEPVPLHCLT